MSNSNLTVYTKLSPNNSGTRTHSIDTITIHCVVGQLSVETIGSIFANSSAQASSNYGIGSDGRVGMYVPENKRSWCSSNNSNDQRAITIECASDTTSPYAVNDKVYDTLLRLCTDICRRNEISELVWSSSKSDRVNHYNGCNMTVHRDFANKACPGDYLYNRMGSIAETVNYNLSNHVLFWGFTGSDVKEMQELLIKAGYSLGEDGADGIFGNATLSAVEKFQGAKGMTSDGICGYYTWKALRGEDSEETVTDTPAEITPEPESKPEPETIEVKTVKLKEADVYSAPPVMTNVTGVFTIIEESGGYGKLKSGAGWIKMPED